MRTSRERSCPSDHPQSTHPPMRCFARLINEKCPSQNPQTRTNSNLQLLTVSGRMGEGVSGGWVSR